MKFFRFSLLVTLVLICQVASADVMTPGLRDQMGSLKSQEMFTVLAVVADENDIAALDIQLHDQMVPRAERHEIVVTRLQETARFSQKDLLVRLESMKKQGLVVSYTSHWLINAVVVRGSREAILELSERKDLARIEADLQVTQVKEMPKIEQNLDKAGGIGVTPGIRSIGADRVWYELGIDGTGTVVGNIDSGVDVLHPALINNWRGNFAPASECWLDASNLGSPDQPVDALEHGTHVMGTITGRAPVDSIGVAPGARWIAANGILLEGGDPLDNAILASLEFMADPDGDPTTLEDVPVVVQNSWGVNEAFAGYYDCDSRWWEAIDNCEAAGVMLVWSAGNEGAAPETMRSPADRATSPYNCFSVGATTHTAPIIVAAFSSRGPSGCGGIYEVKPEIVAPGFEIYSAKPGGSYQLMSGTSMAGPHISGVVALMSQANPDLDVISIKQILMATAIDMGDPGDDNVSGHGSVDAFAAVSQALQGVGQVLITVVDSQTGAPLPGTILSVQNTSFSTLTDENGERLLFLAPGEHDILVEPFGYYEQVETVFSETGVEGSVTVPMSAKPTVTISGQVRSDNGGLPMNSIVTFMGTPLIPAQVDGTGRYSIDVPMGLDYHLRASDPALANLEKFVAPVVDTEVNFLLPQLEVEDFETGDFSLMAWETEGAAIWWVTPDEAATGLYCAENGYIRNQGNSDLILTAEVVDGEVSFDVKVFTDPLKESLTFYIDGQFKKNFFGEKDWAHYSFPVTAGTHTFKWRYGAQRGEGNTWVDNIAIPYPVSDPAPLIALDSAAIEVALNADETTTETLLIGNAGGLDLDFQMSWLDMDWFAVLPVTGVVAAYDSSTVVLDFDALGMGSGVYTGDLVITTNDPGNLERTVPVTLTVTGVSAVGDGLPKPMVLTSAPNPFNPMTNLRFSLPRDSHVELVIYDLAGRQVRSLVLGQMAAGPHEVLWRGLNDNDGAVASGTYLARLRTGNEQRIIKLSLVR